MDLTPPRSKKSSRTFDDIDLAGDNVGVGVGVGVGADTDADTDATTLDQWNALFSDTSVSAWLVSLPTLIKNFILAIILVVDEDSISFSL